MSNFIKKPFGTLAEKPWEKEQAAIDNYHSGKTFNLSKQTSAVIIIFGVSTVLFSVIGQISGQFVKPKKIAVSWPLKDSSVIKLLFISLRKNFEPLKDAT